LQTRASPYPDRSSGKDEIAFYYVKIKTYAVLLSKEANLLRIAL